MTCGIYAIVNNVNGKLIKEFDSMKHLLSENPTYYGPAIYNCMSGHKKTYKGFVWKKVLKI